jgi:hypothetical protein
MGISNIVWTADRVKWLALVGIVAVTAAACGKSPTAPTPGPVPPAATTYSLSGAVLTAGEDGAVPIEGARVAISREADTFEAVTGADGRYEFSNLAAGFWTILVQKEGYADATAEVELSDSTSVDFMLEPMDR